MRFLGHFAVFAALAVAGVNPQLEKVQSIYILPMGNGMDQFLANRITRLGKMQVVADPQKADTILTDRIGEPFEKKLDDLYKPKPPEPPQEDATAAGDDKDQAPAAAKGDQKDAKADTTDAVRKPKERSPLDLKGDVDPSRISSFGRGKGNFFLVDRTTRTVIWSIFEPPKNSTPSELDKTAERVVNHLKQDLKATTQPGE